MRWWVVLVSCAVALTAICVRALQSGDSRARRAARNKKKEVRSLAERISVYAHNVHQRYPTGDVVVSEGDLAEQLRKRPEAVVTAHKGHVGLLACSGMLNGFFGEGDERHIAHWRAVKHMDEFNEEGEEVGETIIRRRERFSHELTLAFENGRIVELKENKENVADGPKKSSGELQHSRGI